MQTFTALYMMPAEGLKAWMEKPEEERKGEEDKMKQEWDAWTELHKDMVLKSVGLGKAKRITKNGVEDASNDLMISSYVQAESLDAAAALFTDHPHLQLEGATIEVMAANEIV